MLRILTVGDIKADCMAHPRATASSRFRVVDTSLPNTSEIIFLRPGILEDPPTASTKSILSKLTLHPSNADKRTPLNSVYNRSQSASNSSLQILEAKSTSFIMHSTFVGMVIVVPLNFFLTFSDSFNSFK
ncbi:hypothetical protein RF11_11034 [Thelohanellus kitauei]|uniref:Uncharacterized protein n=1 Tax=Thelohanellus kitauei TaxID=669202 RepID=A0A0C2MQ52_THEKT|nr:hypothetical protein RF11_11034 [Thelohanellus kitauei]